MATFTNRLATETSPYLLQHAHNPVDWYPWGPEALETAREEGKPIFLSIGYAACHWCHVMEHESFEDEATAKVLNEHFVPIKVDREERPDLDAIYMDAVQAMTGQGGWPMSVFLTPDGKPFYGGTYFPNVRRYGMSSFLDVLESVSRAWREQREQVEGAGRQLVEAIGSRAGSPSATLDGTELDATLLDAAMLGLERSYDVQNGGWGGPPKFPQPMTLEFLLRLHTRTGDARPLAMARHTLDKMSAGGIYDHLGGGFARYATDSIWLVPHFEKMLYDNGQLARVYLHAYQLTGDARYGEVARETLDYLAREMVTTDGALAASQDADTEGEEGLTYVWTAGEIRGALDDEAPLFERAYGVTEGGNWEGATILSRVRSDEALAKDEGMTVEEVRTRLAYARRRLFEVRSRRPQPGRDDKALAAWNGLAIGPFAEAGRILGEQRYVAVGARAAEVLLSDLRTPDGGLMRSWKDGRATANGVLEDFANLADGLLALYEATFDERWFVAARELMEQVLDRFPDAGGGFFDTSRDHEALITRPKGLQDNATPAGNSVAATVLLRLAALTGEGRYRDHAEGALGLVLPVLGRYPTAFGQWLSALDFAIGPVKEVAIVGDPGDPATGALVDVALDGYQARRVVAVSPSASASDSAVPLSKDRPMLDGRPTAYVCEGFVCQRPVTEPEALREQLVPG